MFVPDKPFQPSLVFLGKANKSLLYSGASESFMIHAPGKKNQVWYSQMKKMKCCEYCPRMVIFT
jgi:hypothetical protein